MNNSGVALVLVTHEPAEAVMRMQAFWQELTQPANLVVAYGGKRDEFEKISGQKVFVDDDRLRTRDHQREFQSYSKLLKTALHSLSGSWEWLFFAEFDLIPLTPSFFETLIEEAIKEDADVLGVGACRLDNTLHSHHAAHAAAEGWLEWIRSISRREDPHVVLSCLGCGQLWRREAIEAVVSAGEPVKSYLEILLPTVAHHLGFRVRPWKSHARFILPDPLPHQDLADFVSAGATAVHPIKGYWQIERQNLT